MAFGWFAEFSEGLGVAFGLEEGVVAEAVIAARFLDDLAFAYAVEYFRFFVLPCAGQCDHAAKARGAMVFAIAGKFVQQLGVVLLVGGVSRV